MDVLLILDYLVPKAEYFGICDQNNKDQYNLLDWKDKRTKPTWEEILNNSNLVESNLLKNKCKNISKQLITNSDWSVLPDVKLQNKLEFEKYRSQLRELILNPVENPIFPEEPTPIWSN